MPPFCPRGRPDAAGFSLIETAVASAILLFGMLGVASLQVIGIRGKTFSRSMVTASALAHDLAEQMNRWSYTDSRLTPLGSVSSTLDPALTGLWDMGRLDLVPSNLQAEFGEVAGDANAKTSGALKTGYMGLTAPPGFYRYWNVFALDAAGSGTPQGKVVQIIVRWKEPGLGQRQVALSTYVADSSALWQ